jgi:hypothetical protein
MHSLLGHDRHAIFKTERDSVEIFSQYQPLPVHHTVTKLWWTEHVVQVQEMSSTHNLDVELSSRVTSWKTIEERFTDVVKSLIPKMYENMIMLQLVFSLLKTWHSSQSLIKIRGHMTNIFHVHRMQRAEYNWMKNWRSWRAKSARYPKYKYWFIEQLFQMLTCLLSKYVLSFSLKCMVSGFLPSYSTSALKYFL